MCGGFKRGANACEVFYLTTTGTGIEAFHIATFTFLYRRGNIDLAEVLLADYLPSHLPQFRCGRDEAGYCDDACIDEEFAYLGDATDVLLSVFCRETQIGVDASADVVAVEDAAEEASLVQFSFNTNGYGAFAAAAQASHPYHDASLMEQLLFVLAGKHLVEDGVDYFIGHIIGIMNTLMMNTMIFRGKPTFV